MIIERKSREHLLEVFVGIERQARGTRRQCFSGRFRLVSASARITQRTGCVVDHLLVRSSSSKIVVVGVSSSGFGIGVMSIVLAQLSQLA
jgi:hypothetical protein